MLKFVSLGSGSSGNSYFLFTDEYGLLIDVGIGTRTLKKAFHSNGLSLAQISAVLVTHDHTDHVKAVGSLAGECGVPVYATQLVHEGIRRNPCVSPKIDDGQVRIIEKDKPFKLGAFEVTAFDVPHDSTDNVGYSIQCGDVNFCLITDAGHVTEQFGSFIAKANYLVLEANHDEDMLMMGPYPAYLKGRIRGENGHLSNKSAADVLAESMSDGLRKVWLCHLSEENNHPELARKTVESRLRARGIVVGADLELEVLKRRVPSSIYDLMKLEKKDTENLAG